MGFSGKLGAASPGSTKLGAVGGAAPPAAVGYEATLWGSGRLIAAFEATLWGSAEADPKHFEVTLWGSGRVSAAFENTLHGSGRVVNAFEATLWGGAVVMGAVEAYEATLWGQSRGFAAFTHTLWGSGQVLAAYTATLHGLGRARNDAKDRFELYVGVGAAPDFTAAPEDTQATVWAEGASGFLEPSHTGMTYLVTPAAPGDEVTYQFAVRRRNAWGLVSANQQAWSLTIDDAGAVVELLPSAPTAVSVVPGAGGTVEVSASYVWQAEPHGAAARANTWAIFIRSNGTDPDPDADTPSTETVRSADGTARLTWTSPAYSHGADVRVIVRTRRHVQGPPAVNYDSTNVDVHQATASTAGPAAPASVGVFDGFAGKS